MARAWTDPSCTCDRFDRVPKGISIGAVHVENGTVGTDLVPVELTHARGLNGLDQWILDLVEPSIFVEHRRDGG
jgi:hypothetical protein